ncbi:MAG: DUF2807 domain-containing protein [Dehalococcoidales bacterium]|nr:DUF2807 domain-containing protein [Dehalococcoidales bacterium]
MRKAILSITNAAILLVVTILSGCSSAAPRGVTTEKIDFTNFTDVDVENILEVEIVQSSSFSVTIIADEDLRDYVVVSKEGETLKITLNPHHLFTDFTTVRKTLTAKITMPAIYRLYLSGAVKGTITGFKSPHDLTLSIDGASSLNLKDIEVGDIKSVISGASKVTGNLKAGDVEFEVSGASKVELAGSADRAIFNVSGASTASMPNFILNNASINLSGASEATLNVEEKLALVLSGVSKLYFYGNPTVDNISVSGASTIKHK